MPLVILYVGSAGGTCAHRARALRELGHRVRHVSTDLPSAFAPRLVYRLLNRVGRPPDWAGVNRRIAFAARRTPFDLLWVDKGRTIRPTTLRRLALEPAAPVRVSYSPDDMMNPSNQSVRYRSSIPHYDLHVTTKSFNVAELRAVGARDVLFVDNAFDPDTHRPVELDSTERRRFAADVGFVGAYESERAHSLLDLAAAGIPVRVFGPGWKRFSAAHPGFDARDAMLEGIDYAKAICASRINLGFLRKVNRDLQTTRSIEIPACGGFLLAERTAEHLRLFREGEEAEFFGSFDELLAKCRYYLEHDQQRARIALAGRRRCLESGYSNAERLRGVLEHLRAHHGLAGSRA